MNLFDILIAPFVEYDFMARALVGAAVVVLEVVDGLGRVRTLIVGVQEAVVIAIRRGRRRRWWGRRRLGRRVT